MVTFTQPDAENYENDDATTWKPTAGSPEKILGTVTERLTVTREDGSEVELIKLTDAADNKWLVWVSPKMLRDCVRRDNPQLGDTWGIEFQGTKPIAPGRTMHLYASGIKPANATPAATPAVQPNVTSGPKDAPAFIDGDDPF